MATIWILDENSQHVATISGPQEDVEAYACEVYPHGPTDDFIADRIGPGHANANFDLNPDAIVVKL